MSNKINLVERQTEKDIRSEFLQRIKKASFLILFIVGLISIVTFLLSYRFSIGYVKTQEDKLIKKMASFDQIGSKVFLLNSRLSDISIILSTRTKYNQKSELIVNAIPENLKIADYEIDSSGIKIQANSENLSDINNFLNSVLTLVKNEKISSVLINNLYANASGYSIQVTLN